MKSKSLLLLFVTTLAWSSLSALGAGEPLSPEQGLKRLLDGNKRFVEGTAVHPHQGTAYRASLANGQKPFVAVLTCADSRVSPELLFDQGLGDIFDCRVVGNVADEDEMGGLEYAVEHLHTKLIVVLGHEKCGAVKAAVEAAAQGGGAPGHLGGIVQAIAPSVQAAREQSGDLLSNAVRANVERVVKQLNACAPILSEQVEKGELLIVGARYDIATGAVEIIAPSAAVKSTAQAIHPPAAH